MKNKSIVVKLLLPSVVMVIFAALLFVQMTGIAIEERSASIELLTDDKPEATETDPDAATILVAYDASNSTELAFFTTLTDTLDELKMDYLAVDVFTDGVPDLDQFTMFLYCGQYLSPLSECMDCLFEWIDAGGHFALLMPPVTDSPFQILYRKLGIIQTSNDYLEYNALQYTTGLLPLWEDQIYSEDDLLSDYALVVQLDAECTVHMVSADDNEIPLLWEKDVGEGRIVVLNTTLMRNKSGRGYALSALCALEDTLVYPIINAAMIFIDDFPAPQPDGFDEALKEEFGYDIQGFFRNHWWPDMKELCWDLGVRYTGLLIETYNANVTGPFDDEGVDDVLLKYYTAEILNSGGEIGLHGYNHQSLCMEGFDYGDIGYTPWPSTEAMANSLLELQRYAQSLFISSNYITYVPPSNLLSEIGRQTLIETLPNIRVIAGLYLTESGTNAYYQEFEEDEDGIINVPRISSGFEPDSFACFVATQELALHGVFSHFIHPDDILDSDRGAADGWTEMYTAFRAMIESLTETYPEIRFLTAAEGAAAIQRYDRLEVTREYDDAGVTITLTNFYDEAWLALRTGETPASVTGGEIFTISDGFYWIRADEAVVRVEWEAGT